MICLSVLLGLTLTSLPTPLVIDSASVSRAERIVLQMTLEEKIDFIAGDADGFHIYGIERLGVPEIRTSDGPQGLRNNTQSTMYPCGAALSASWNRDLALKYGSSIGSDARARGVHILLAPGVNIYRAPMCGRNFEYYGEDPYLASETALRYILGVQNQGVMATVKHFCANNQEWSRHHASSDVDERTLNEIYFPAFRKAVVEGGVGSVMSSYNLLNSVHASESTDLVKTLRETWGFNGIYMSDWAATYSTVAAANAGLDLEMPIALYYTRELLLKAVENGTVRVETIDEKCRHILQTFIAFGFLDREQKDESIPLDNPASDAVALEVARESVVLLKNEGILPLSRNLKRIVVLGPNADCIPTGGGSGFVEPYHTKTLLASLCEQYRRADVLHIPFKGRIDAAQAPFDECQRQILSDADVIIYCGGFNSVLEHEDGDRQFELPAAQLAQIRETSGLNPKLVTVLYGGGGIRIADFENESRAILMAWYPGQAGGQALAEILTGKVNPSGRLPISIERRFEDNPVCGSYYENTFRNLKSPYSRVNYDEGVFVGYRGYLHNDVAPHYPFGFGLSYTDFEFEDLQLEKLPGNGVVEVSFTVKNVGRRAGAAVAQVYVGECSPSVPRPSRELKGYEKIYLKSGQSSRVKILLDRTAFEYYDTLSHGFVHDNGEFKIMVGESVLDLALEGTINY